MDYIKLCDVCDFQGGSQPPKEEWSFDLRDGYIRMLQIRDFTQSERVTPEYIKITKTTKMCESDDILIARYGASLGKVLTGLAGAYNVAIMRTIPNTEILEKKYLYYYLKSPAFQLFLRNIGSRAAQAGFNKFDLQELLIPNITKTEQAEVVSILEKVESVITSRQQELQKLNELVKARFVEMFGSEATLGIPLKDCCIDVRGGGTPSMQHPEYYGGSVPFIKSGDIRGDRVSSGALWLAEKALTEANAKYIPKGSVLVVNRSAALLREFRAAIAAQPVVINQDIKAFIPKQSFLPEYLLWAIKMQAQYLLTKVTTVLTSHIDLKDLLELRIAPVSIERQYEFSSFISQVDKSKVVESIHRMNVLFNNTLNGGNRYDSGTNEF